MSTIAKLVIFLSAGIICITPTELSAQDYFDRLSKKDVVTYDAVQRRSYKIECLTPNFDFIICIALQKPDHIFIFPKYTSIVAPPVNGVFWISNSSISGHQEGAVKTDGTVIFDPVYDKVFLRDSMIVAAKSLYSESESNPAGLIEIRSVEIELYDISSGKRSRISLRVPWFTGIETDTDTIYPLFREENIIEESYDKFEENGNSDDFRQQKEIEITYLKGIYHAVRNNMKTAIDYFSKAINLLDNTTAPLPYDKKEIADLVMSNIKSVQEN